jgi:replicative DNA helicase
MLTDSFDKLKANPAEVSVIGSMLIDDRTIPSLMQQLTADDFTDNDLRHMFEAVRSIFLERGKVDSATVLGQLEEEGYREKLYAILDLTPSASNCEAYAKILRDQRQLREIQSACFEICSSGTDLPTARELMAKAAGMLVQNQADRDRSYSDLIEDFLARQKDRTPPDHLDWGIPVLNEKLMTGAGRFVIIGADSSVGKTALALQFALSFAKSGKKVGFFSYETTLADVADRLLANDADVSLGRAKGKHLDPGEIKRVSDVGYRSSKLDLRILESARYTVADIRAKSIARGFQVILVDYVQLIPTRKKERYEAVTEISIELHALAQELGITVIGLSQVTVPETDKKGNRRYISKDDLRESRQLKQDADVILLLDLSDPKDRDSNRVLQIEKNRDGPLGHLVLSFNASRMRFDYVPPVEGTEEAASRERIAKMDENRIRRQEKQRGAPFSQYGIFEELDDEEGDELPF